MHRSLITGKSCGLFKENHPLKSTEFSFLSRKCETKENVRRVSWKERKASPSKGEKEKRQKWSNMNALYILFIFSFSFSFHFLFFIFFCNCPSFFLFSSFFFFYFFYQNDTVQRDESRCRFLLFFSINMLTIYDTCSITSISVWNNTSDTSWYYLMISKRTTI